MEEIQNTKIELRSEVAEKLAALSDEDIREKTKAIEDRLFEFANFLESNIALMYIHRNGEVATGDMLKRCFDYNKIVILPIIEPDKAEMTLMKIDHLDKDLTKGPGGVLQPNVGRCKVVPIDCIDIAIIPGISLDEKGGRLGSGKGYYDRLIPKLSITTRKVALAMEEQIVPQIPMEPHDKHVDIIITENRIIYKI